MPSLLVTLVEGVLYGSWTVKVVRDYPGCVYGCFQKYGKTPKSSILIGFSIINHPFGGAAIFGNTHMDQHILYVYTYARFFLP